MLVAACFFVSGAAALVLQVLWVRMLGHVFGATALAVSTTLTAFMGGLALGAYLAGRVAPRLARPIRAFALLESAVGLYGLFVPGLLALMPEVQRAIAPGELGFAGHSLLRFIVVAAILALPTTAMGATLPILAEGVVKASTEMASRVSRLYAANTAGAVFGAVLGGFVLIPALGITKTVYVAAAMDLGVALFVLVVGRTLGDRALVARFTTPSVNDIVRAAAPPVEALDVSPRAARLAVLAFALSGAAAMALQVLWSRAVGVVIGASTYAFTLILTTFLVGLTAGAAVLARVVDRVARPVLWLARTQILIGVLAALGTLFVDRLPFWLHARALEEDVSVEGLYFTSFAIAALVIAPATMALGAVLPLVMRILAPQGEGHAGPLVARAYTFNTVGAIAGSFAGGFVLLPMLGVQPGLALAAGASVLIGLALSWTAARDAKTLVAGALALALLALSPRWDVSRWTAGLFRVYLARSVFADGWEAGGELVYHRDGVASTVTVERARGSEGVWLKVNGKVDASDIGDMPTQVLSGVLPVLAHGDPKEVLVIGYGSGVTPGAVLKTGVERVVLVEIEAAVLEAADRFFAHVNGRPWEDPRFTAIVDDGRNYLLTRDRRFDVIISEPSNPWMSGASSLFTKDFFEIARRRLDERGVFLQWLQLYELSPKNIHAILRTFQSVFPEVLVFTPNPASNDTLLLGSARPIVLDRARLDRAFGDPKLRAELARAKVSSPEDLLGLFVVGGADLVELVGAGPINTDDNAMVEFGAPKDLLEFSESDAKLPFVEAIDGHRFELLPAHFIGFDFDGAEDLAYAAYRLLRQGRVADAERFLAEAERRDDGRASAEIARIRDRLARLTEAAGEPVLVDTADTRTDERYARVARAMLSGDEQRALDLADHPDGFEKLGTGHRFLYAYLTYRFERLLDAGYLIEGVLEDASFVERFPTALYYGARIAMDRGKNDEALELMERFVDAGTSTRAAR